MSQSLSGTIMILFMIKVNARNAGNDQLIQVILGELSSMRERVTTVEDQLFQQQATIAEQSLTISTLEMAMADHENKITTLIPDPHCKSLRINASK